MEQDEAVVFEVKDRRGRLVRLRETVYLRHLPTHPEMADYLEEAKRTIADPDYELKDDEAEGECIIYYRLGLGREVFEKCFVTVPVHYAKTLLWGEVGEVATFYLPRKLGRGKVSWTRSKR